MLRHVSKLTPKAKRPNVKKFRRDEAMQRVMIDAATYDSCREAVDHAFELFPLAVRGKRVLVKPNVLRGSDPDEAIVTHPALVRAVVEKLLGLGPAEIIVGDNPGATAYGANEKSFQQAGLIEAAKGCYRNIGTDSVEVNLDGGFVDRVSISRAVSDADILISLPKFKTHGLTTISGAIKNSYGIIPGAQKAMLHGIAETPWRFNELVVHVFSLRVPDLFIVDAVVGMEGNGPVSTDLRRINKVLAADNAVALDATIARMMGVEPGALRFLEVAKEHGLGDHEAESIEVVGSLTPIRDFKLPAGTAHDARNVRGFLESRAGMRPQVDQALCTACETCVEHCPASALTMKDGFPVADRSKCLACFCCQEMCPEKAISLR
jgi:uncharacterized protein (DUF362 family)/Pyruvate/2-oxoacid:ferredoxin oxidoreductase delta subunit